MAEHSPEPWTLVKSYHGPEWADDGRYFIHSGPWHVATVHAHQPGIDAVDNARLVKAAPLLLRALKTLLPVAQAFEKQASRGTGGRRGGAVFALARKAIDEAESDARKEK